MPALRDFFDPPHKIREFEALRRAQAEANGRPPEESRQPSDADRRKDGTGILPFVLALLFAVAVAFQIAVEGNRKGADPSLLPWLGIGGAILPLAFLHFLYGSPYGRRMLGGRGRLGMTDRIGIRIIYLVTYAFFTIAFHL